MIRVNKTEHRTIGKLVKDLRGKTSHTVRCGGQTKEFFIK